MEHIREKRGRFPGDFGDESRKKMSSELSEKTVWGAFEKALKKLSLWCRSRSRGVSSKLPRSGRRKQRECVENALKKLWKSCRRRRREGVNGAFARNIRWSFQHQQPSRQIEKAKGLLCESQPWEERMMKEQLNNREALNMVPEPDDFSRRMADRDTGVLLILSAPSGSGKTTLARRLVEEQKNTVFSVSYTTRPPRGKEKDGVDYVFVDESRFRDMVRDELFVEWAEVHGNFYGTPAEPVEKTLKSGGLIIFDIDVQGGEQIKSRYPSAISVLLLPPSWTELERRLRDRGTDDDRTIQRRLLAAKSEVRKAASYDYCVVNDDLETALKDLRAIVRAERLRLSRVDLSGTEF